MIQHDLQIKQAIKVLPLTSSATIVLLYMGITADANPKLRPRRALQNNTHQKLLIRIAIRGKTVPKIPIMIKDYKLNFETGTTVLIPQFLEIQTPMGDPIIAKTRIVEVNNP